MKLIVNNFPGEVSLFYNQPKNNLKLTNNYCYQKFINKKKKINCPKHYKKNPIVWLRF